MTEEQIIYSVIAKGEKPLVEYSLHTGIFRQQCINYLSKVEKNSQKAVLIDDNFIYYLNDNHNNTWLTYMIMTSIKYPKSTAVGCLEDIKKTFTSQEFVSDIDFDGILKFGLNSKFQETLKEKITYYNENQEVSSKKISELKNHMDSLKTEVIKTAGLLDERGDKIKVLSDKSDTLLDSSNNYYRESIKVRKKECWNKYKLYIGIGVAVIVVIGIIVLICAV